MNTFGITGKYLPEGLMPSCQQSARAVEQLTEGPHCVEFPDIGKAF